MPAGDVRLGMVRRERQTRRVHRRAEEGRAARIVGVEDRLHGPAAKSNRIADVGRIHVVELFWRRVRVRFRRVRTDEGNREGCCGRHTPAEEFASRAKCGPAIHGCVWKLLFLRKYRANTTEQFVTFERLLNQDKVFLINGIAAQRTSHYNRWQRVRECPDVFRLFAAMPQYPPCGALLYRGSNRSISSRCASNSVIASSPSFAVRRR